MILIRKANMKSRQTIQCALVAEAVRSLRCHATADEVYDEVRRAHPHISRGTVYRNLNSLAEDGSIRKIPVPGGADRFDHRCDEHYHIKCTGCGRIFDVDMDAITDIGSRIKDRHGFEFSRCDIVFTGLCPECIKCKGDNAV